MDDGLMLALPRHVAEVLALVGPVITEVKGVDYLTDFVPRYVGTYVPVNSTTDLGDGDKTDVFLKVVD